MTQPTQGAHLPPITAHYRPLPPVLREEPLGDSAVPRLELREWAERYGVVAGITGRGQSGSREARGTAEATAGFSLGLWSEENVGQVMTRWRAFRAAFRPAFATVILSHQVHGSAVRWHRQMGEGWLVLDGVDGHATSTRGVLLAVTVADCIPVYLIVPEKGVVALLHAGWRGAAGGILERGVELLEAEARATPSDIVMHCGIGICGACYEVGSEVLALLGAQPTSSSQAVSGHIDLRNMLARRAERLGLTDVTCSPWCSAHDREHFFSHRASGGRDGRMVAYLGMPATR